MDKGEGRFKRDGVEFVPLFGEVGKGEMVWEFSEEEEVGLYRDTGYVRGWYDFTVESEEYRRVLLRLKWVRGVGKVVIELNPVMEKLGLVLVRKEVSTAGDWLAAFVYCNEVRKSVYTKEFVATADTWDVAFGRIWEVKGEISIKKTFPLVKVWPTGVSRVYYCVSSSL